MTASGMTSNGDGVVEKNSQKKSNFRIREFKERESLLRVMFESNKDIKYLLGLIEAVVLFHFAIRVIDNLQTGSLNQDFLFLYWSFCENFSVLLVNWSYLHVYVFICYFLTNLWIRQKVSSSVYI